VRWADQLTVPRIPKGNLPEGRFISIFLLCERIIKYFPLDFLRFDVCLRLCDRNGLRSIPALVGVPQLRSAVHRGRERDISTQASMGEAGSQH
jgi:hypothetical protein